ncbi:hypothetical protein JK359_37275 [Streptomyces actinomycinicus]|uniref:Uncharacterized protein n=1 Tax=Streptomyces actinomycinicus TaxID=1695166 RepID=A0A937ESY4_9ACTN|nr:hypothetical protein [Streptomyces actinomycinicus]MBL1087530.1 hypothetical protein [Streptomyces actinomycinicus]
MGGGAAVAGRAEADPEPALVLLRLAEDIEWPVTAVDGSGIIRFTANVVPDTANALQAMRNERLVLAHAVHPAAGPPAAAPP